MISPKKKAKIKSIQTLWLVIFYKAVCDNKNTIAVFICKSWYLMLFDSIKLSFGWPYDPDIKKNKIPTETSIYNRDVSGFIEIVIFNYVMNVISHIF